MLVKLTPSGAIDPAPFLQYVPYLIANNRLGWDSLPLRNTLAYYPSKIVLQNCVENTRTTIFRFLFFYQRLCAETFARTTIRRAALSQNTLILYSLRILTHKDSNPNDTYEYDTYPMILIQ